MEKAKVFFIAIFFFAHLSICHYAMDLTSDQILNKTEELYRGSTSQSDAEMHIITANYERILKVKCWDNRAENKNLIIITYPPKEKGNSTLKVGDNMWEYNATVEKVFRLPPSALSLSWNGSEFSNDEILKKTDVIRDYNNKILPDDDPLVYKIESIPKPDTPVVWGKIIRYIKKDNFTNLKKEFYDEKGRLIKYEVFSNFKLVNKRMIPFLAEMVNVIRLENRTVMKVYQAEVDKPIDDYIFTLEYLRRQR